MKVIWEARDITPGRRVGKPARIERHMVGYTADQTEERRFCLVSLSDGAVWLSGADRATVADTLNSQGELPLELLDGSYGKSL